MIRSATLDDFHEVLRIRSLIGLRREKLNLPEYTKKATKQGFLLYPTISYEEYKKELKKLFLVFVESNIVKGFISIDDQHAIIHDSPIVWENLEMKTIYFSSPHAYISSVAVDPIYANQGIATQLLQEAITHLTNSVEYLFSIIVTSPVSNEASIKFHEKNNFERVARLNYPHRAELDNYGSIVYAKKL